jgi:hypothetical protein
VAVQPREGGETSQTRATGERMVRPGPCPPRAAPARALLAPPLLVPPNVIPTAINLPVVALAASPALPP